MFKLLKKSDCQIMLWKNGRGITSQIAIEPAGASFADGDFLWRLSSAQVHTSDSFSEFPGCDRILMVWFGSGLRLNDRVLLPDQPFSFAGEEAISCTLINGPVVDLGLIHRRGKVTAKFAVIQLTENESTLDLPPDWDTHFIFCGTRNIQIENFNLEIGDVLKIDNPQPKQLSVKAQGPAKIYHIGIHVL